MAAPKPPRASLKSKVIPGALVLCPLTGSMIFGKRIKPHSIQLRKCKNDTLFAVCSLHQCRMFLSDMGIVQELIGASNYESVEEK